MCCINSFFVVSRLGQVVRTTYCLYAIEQPWVRIGATSFDKMGSRVGHIVERSGRIEP